MMTRFFFLLFLMILPGIFADPNIGLIYNRDQYNELLEDRDYLSPYREALEIAGANVVVLYPGYEDEFVQSQLKQIQGLLIPGGVDIDPQYYGEEVNNNGETINRDLDAFEFKILGYCVERELPVLGICRGHQFLNVYFGGSLYQDIPSQYQSKDKVLHRIKVENKIKPCFHFIHLEKDSTFWLLLQKDDVPVNSYHHQAVKKLATGFKVTARSTDGLVEAIESTGKIPMMGFQFHPERLRLENPKFNSIFSWLVEESKKKLAK